MLGQSVALAFPPSPHQQAVIDFVLNGRGHGVVEAVAGSGKSTLLRMVAERLQSNGIAVCFNKHAAEALQSKLKHTKIRAATVHSLGLAAVRKAFQTAIVNADKYTTHLQEVLQARHIEPRSINRKALLRIFDLFRHNLMPINEESWVLMTCEHNLDVDISPELGVELCQELAKYGHIFTREIDFTDMIWLPVVLKLCPTKFSWLLVDEAQDISRLQYAFLKMSLLPGGRSLFVGDRRQAIYHFAGADAESFQNIIDDLSATLLPLSVCYRCPTQIIYKARLYCPQIEAAPGAAEGVIRHLSAEMLIDDLKEGDLVLSRTTAPVIRICYSLIAQKISAAVRGRDIGKGLTAVIKKVCGTDTSISSDELEKKLSAHFATEKEKALRIHKELAREATLMILADKQECLDAVMCASGVKTAEEAIESIESIFSDERASIYLSTIHRAKGLENDRVFVLRPKNQSFDGHQENNLRYVAATRAVKELIFVLDAGDRGLDPEVCLTPIELFNANEVDGDQQMDEGWGN
jgi:DNA helicase-2/ATP-dependent DNA helicase PcrA